MNKGFLISVSTAQFGNDMNEWTLDIDIARKIPNIIGHLRKKNSSRSRGPKVSVTMEGN